MAYSSGPDNVTDLNPDEFLSYGIPRVNPDNVRNRAPENTSKHPNVYQERDTPRRNVEPPYGPPNHHPRNPPPSHHYQRDFRR